MATTGIVNILHTFAMTKHGTCTLASFFFFLKAETFDAACKLHFSLQCVPQNESGCYLYNCPLIAVANILSGATND